MEKTFTGEKLILAILQGEDYDDTVYALNQKGFFATLLSSTGGFLKKKSTTIMIGVEGERLPEVLDVLKQEAGRRQEKVYQNIPVPVGRVASPILPTAPMVHEAGGVVVFVMDLERIEKF